MLTRLGRSAGLVARKASARPVLASRCFATASAAPQRDLRWYNSELNRCLKMRYFPEALALYSDMKKANVEADAVTHELIFSVYSELQDGASAAELMAHLKAKGVKTLLQQVEDQAAPLSKAREDHEKLLRLFEKFERMKKAGVNVFSSP